MMVDFGVWSTSWGGVDHKVERRLASYGWDRGETVADLTAYTRDDTTIWVSHLGYMLCADGDTGEAVCALIGRFWRWREAGLYPCSIVLPDGRWDLIPLLLAETAFRQVVVWMNRPLVRGVKSRSVLLLERCRRVGRLHPMADGGLWERAWTRLSDWTVTLGGQATTEDSLDVEFPLFAYLGTILTSAGVAAVALLPGRPVLPAILAISGACLIAIALLGERLGV